MDTSSGQDILTSRRFKSADRRPNKFCPLIVWLGAIRTLKTNSTAIGRKEPLVVQVQDRETQRASGSSTTNRILDKRIYRKSRQLKKNPPRTNAIEWTFPLGRTPKQPQHNQFKHLPKSTKKSAARPADGYTMYTMWGRLEYTESEYPLRQSVVLAPRVECRHIINLWSPLHHKHK